jgi:hypothetical protein
MTTRPFTALHHRVEPNIPLVALAPAPDLLFRAKDLFVAAMNGKRPQPFDGPGQVKAEWN